MEKVSNISSKTFHFAFSKIKCLPRNLSPPPTLEDDENFAPIVSKKRNQDRVHDLTSDSTSKSFAPTSSTEDIILDPDRDPDSDSVLDFSTIFTSGRFFPSAPGSSNSIMEESPDTVAPLEVYGGVAVQTYSPDPCADFRSSMQEMVEARKLTDVKADWEVLHELLLCYLSLNPKHNHKFIVNAFADLVISLVS